MTRSITRSSLVILGLITLCGSVAASLRRTPNDPSTVTPASGEPRQITAPGGDSDPGVDGDGDGFTTLDGDCNDADPATYPGAPEICDARDNDCDGSMDDGPACDPTCDAPEKIGDDVRITNAAGRSIYPTILWTGTEFGLFWVDDRDGGRGVYFARLDARGRKIGDDVFVLRDSYFRPAGWGWSFVWTGSEYSIFWDGPKSKNGAPWVTDLFFSLFDRAGVKVGGDVRLDVNAPDSVYRYPLVVWNGDGYGMVWTGESAETDYHERGRFTRLDRSGRNIGPIWYWGHPDDPGDVRLAWAGGEYAYSWVDGHESGAYFSLGRRDQSGKPVGRVCGPAAAYGDPSGPSIIWAGSGPAVVWNGGGEEDPYGTYFWHKSWIECEQQRPSARLVIPDRHYQAIAWTGREFGLIWAEPTTPLLRFARLDTDGERIGSEVLVQAKSARGGYEASMAWTGRSYGVVWADYRDEEIYFSRIACDCKDTDGDGYRDCEDDCDDENASVHPGAIELPGNAADEDCDGARTCDPAGNWENQGLYVRCVVEECGRLVKAGLVTRRQCASLVAEAMHAEVIWRASQRP